MLRVVVAVVIFESGFDLFDPCELALLLEADLASHRGVQQGDVVRQVLQQADELHMENKRNKYDSQNNVSSNQTGGQKKKRERQGTFSFARSLLFSLALEYRGVSVGKFDKVLDHHPPFTPHREAIMELLYCRHCCLSGKSSNTRCRKSKMRGKREERGRREGGESKG